MPEEFNQLTDVNIEDLLDWAYCPLMIWWNTKSNLREFVSSGYLVSGERLMKQSVRKSLELFHQAKMAKPDDERITLEVLYKFVWKNWLEKRDLVELMPVLAKYAKDRDSIIGMEKFRANPATWTQEWKNDSANANLVAMQNLIDENNEKAGIATLKLPDDTYLPVMGLAEAYYFSDKIIRDLSRSLPPIENIVGVYQEVSIDLLSVKIKATADIVICLGDAPRKVGRPSKNQSEDEKRKIIQYELHDFDKTIPSINDLGQNLRLSVLRNAYPVGSTEDKFTVESVLVRHMKTGMSQPFPSGEGFDTVKIESLAQSYLNASRAGWNIPRMIAGWRACQDCPNRFLCFADEGVMEMFNPPLISQTDCSVAMRADVKKLIASKRDIPQKEAISLLKDFTVIKNNSNAITQEGVVRLLESLEEEMEKA